MQCLSFFVELLQSTTYSYLQPPTRSPSQLRSLTKTDLKWVKVLKLACNVKEMLPTISLFCVCFIKTYIPVVCSISAVPDPSEWEGIDHHLCEAVIDVNAAAGGVLDDQVLNSFVC